MKLHRYLQPDLVVLGLEAQGVEPVLRRLVVRLGEAGVVEDEGPLLDALLEREAVQSTAIGRGVAIPHAVCTELDSPVILLALSPEGAEFNAVDEEPVHTFFLLLSPPDHAGTHIKLLARIARLMRQPDLREQLRSVSDPEQVIERVRELDEQHP